MCQRCIPINKNNDTQLPDPTGNKKEENEGKEQENILNRT